MNLAMGRIMNSPRGFRSSIAPVIVLGLTGSVVTLVLPAILAETLPGSNLVSRLVAVEMFGATVATACLSPFLALTNRRHLAIVAAIAATILDMISTQTLLAAPLEFVRCAAGLAEGTVLALSVAYVASSEAPERNLALFVATNLSTATVILKLLPATVAIAGHRGPFSLFVALATLSTLASLVIPDRGKASVDRSVAMARSRSDARRRVSRWAVTVGLLAFVALAAGAGSVWPSLVRFASAIDLPVDAVTRILGDATFAGIAGALLAAWLGAICTRRTVVALGTLAMLGSVTGLGDARDTVGFACCAMVFMASWMFLVPSYMGALAAADSEGRAAAFSLATQYGGLALGAGLANFFVRSGQNRPILLVGGLLFAVAMVMVIYADRVAMSKRTSMCELA